LPLPVVKFVVSKPGFYMKTLTRNFLSEIFTNSINRDLVVIFLATLFAAIILVTASIVLLYQ